MSFQPLHLIKPLYNSGAGGGGGGTTDDDPAKNGKKPLADRLKETFTEDEISTLFGDRATRAANKAVTDLLTGLGFTNADELKTRLTKAKELEDGQKTDLQKAQTDVADWKKKYEDEHQKVDGITAKANETLMRAAVITNAATFHDPNEAWLHVDRSKITVEEDGTVKGAKEAVEAVAKAKAHLVKPVSNGKGTPRSEGKGGGKSPKDDLLSKKRQQIGSL